MYRLPILLAIAMLTACSTAYYSAMEQFGIHKREILVDRVGDARDAQQDAKEQFVSALEQFRSVVSFQGGDLEANYDRLNGELERSENKAAAVHDRVDAVEDVAEALFSEWEDELAQYSSESLRARSEQQLRETRARYQTMMTAMRRAEARIEPVLAPFRDQVLYLKHNLNAQAIASLAGEVAVIESDVESLVRDLEESIAAADEFMRQTGL